MGSGASVNVTSISLLLASTRYFTPAPASYTTPFIKPAKKLLKFTLVPVVVTQVLVPVDRADDLVCARETAAPTNLRAHIFAAFADVDDHAFDQQADDLLPFGRRRRGGVPEGRDVAGRRGDPGELVPAQLGRLILPESVVFFFESALTDGAQPSRRRLRTPSP